MEDLITVAEKFRFGGQVHDVQRYGSGNLNDTFLVTLSHNGANHAILQRVNQQVFHHPEWIMLNLRVVMEYLRAPSTRTVLDVCDEDRADRRWEFPSIICTDDGRDYFVDAEGGFWRALSFIDGAKTYDTIQDRCHAEEVGYALGRFQRSINGLDVRKFYDTLEGFHITPRYLSHYDEVLVRNARQSSPEVRYALTFVETCRAWASILEDAKSKNELLLRPIHGDPKVNNIMIDERTGAAVSIVDLDTIKPGLVHYDIGDCLRSSCNLLGEETTDIENVRFDTDLCRAILQGYLSVARAFLTEKDYAYLYDAVRLIAFELGLRFFTDYLEGDVYFKVRYAGHNLYRALVQFKLVESIEIQAGIIQKIIDDLK